MSKCLVSEKKPRPTLTNALSPAVSLPSALNRQSGFVASVCANSVPRIFPSSFGSLRSRPIVAPMPQQPIAAPMAQQPVAAPNPFYASAPAAPHSAPSPFGQPAPFAAASPYAEAPSDEEYGFAAKSGSKVGLYFFVLAIAGAIIAAVCVMRPWASTYTPPPAPVEWHVPPPPAPVAEPPAATPPQPTVAPKASAPVAAPATATRSERKRAKHSADDDSASDKGSGSDSSDDPLAGTNL